MKVFITQGHEKGIGLEVFFKSVLLLTKTERAKLVLIAYKESVENTLKSLSLPFHISEQNIEVAGIIIEVLWQTEVKVSQSFTALNTAMKLAESGAGVLYTLPTSKDQFPGFPGHTEFFRANYKCSDLGMFFSSKNMQVLLLTDHHPIRDLSELITEDLIYSRVKVALKALDNWTWPVDRVLISGLNPHSGENGLIGNEDQRITQAIKRIKSELNFNISGPYPGDTMLFEQKSPNDLLIYLFHDQGLGVFKGLQGLIGSNITLGLPFPRFSPDHGTSFNLYAKNQADYRGCAFSLKQAVSMLKRIGHEKNSSHQS